MLKSIATAARRAALASTPFLLSACGEDNNGPQKFEIVLIPLLFVTVSLAYDWLNDRTTGLGIAATIVLTAFPRPTLVERNCTTYSNAVLSKCFEATCIAPAASNAPLICNRRKTT